MVHAVTRYVARRLVERERALADDAALGEASALKMMQQEQRARPRWRAIRTFIFGVVVGVAALMALALAQHKLARALARPDAIAYPLSASHDRAAGVDAPRETISQRQAPGAPSIA